MRKVWIVVANTSHSKIYRAENVETLVEHKCFEHAESELPARELTADRDGRTTNRKGFGTDTMEEKTPIKVKEATQFAQEISRYLEENLNAGAFERLYIIAGPSFLGHLRQTLAPNVAKTIKKEIQKDLTQIKAKEVRDYLPPVL